MRTKIHDKLPSLKNNQFITFDDLQNAGGKPLKVLASDLGSRKPKIYGGSDSMRDGVLDAVRGSISYPLVYQPMIMNQQRFVDGGLSCNLPLSIFEDERKTQNIPVIAFDLVSEKRAPSDNCTFSQFLSDMAATALESSENLLSSVVRDVVHVQISVPNDINSLDFDLPIAKREQLYEIGKSATHDVLIDLTLRPWMQAHEEVERIQALYAPAFLVTRVLKSIAQEAESVYSLQESRANVFLPTNSGRLKIIYQYGMDNDSDLGIDFSQDGGSVGRCYSDKKPQIANLEMAAQNKNFEAWKMSQVQQNQVRQDRKVALCVPIFDPNSRENIRGVLAIDSSTPMSHVNELLQGNIKEGPIAFLVEWADIISRVIFA